jgi:hypothetical protein
MLALKIVYIKYIINACFKNCLYKVHNKMNYELMLTYDTTAYMFNVYKNQLNRQTRSFHIGMPYFWTRQIPTSCLPI